MKYLLSLCILAVAFLLNPLWGCGGDAEPDFEYDRQDMVDYAAGNWSGSLKWASGEQTDFELVISEHGLQEQGLEVREVKQSSCSRQFSQNFADFFVRPAYACASISTLPVQARLSTSDGRYQDEILAGDIQVWSRIMGRVQIMVALGDGGELHAECDADFQCAEGWIFEMENNQRDHGEFIAMQKN